MNYIARSNKSGKSQTLVNHLAGVSNKIRSLADQAVFSEITGMLHDIGKYSLAFQDYIRSNSIENKPDHSSAGAQWILNLLSNRAKQVGDEEIERVAQLIARLISHCIVGHHSGLLNGISVGEGTSLDHRLTKTLEPYLNNIAPEVSKKIDFLGNLLLSEDNLNYICRWIDSDGNISGRDAYSLQFAIRMLFSALVDADRLDSEQAGNPDQWKTRMSVKKDTFPVLLKKLEDFLETLPSNGTVNKVRKAVSEQCKHAASSERGFFDLTVPTGGGKTFASLRFALHHAIKYRMQRVLYVMPYTTIIDQNADEFRKVLDPDNKSFNVLEHYSNMEPEKETPENELLADNWESPIIVTTSVQFFESLYAAKPSRCRRLHAIRRAVIILDEAQTVPVRYLKAVTWVLEELVTNYNGSVVFCTATQPLLDSKRLDADALDNHRIGVTNIRPIVTDPQKHFLALSRVQVRPIDSEEPISPSDIAARVKEKVHERKSVLCIFNTKSNAKTVFKELKKDEIMAARLWYLSTGMCPQHRKDVIEIVKLLTSYCRKTGTKAPVVISTQLVEAGVNLDFDVVFRAMAGIDSIAQAAGRCNREGRMSHPGEVYFFRAEENLRSLRDISEAKRAGLDTLSALDGDSTLTLSEKDPIGLKAVEEYFQRLYWSRASEMDAKGIVTRLASPRRLEEGADVPFATIADEFRFIEKDTVTILVPYGEVGKSLAEKLIKGGMLGLDEYKTARRYSVQVFRDAFLQFAPLVVETKSGWLVLADGKHYNETGLMGPHELSVEDYIV
ncbi:MAG: CRISPR-associated helicase Cas3' [Candidatus Omnitrophota bacterium]|nr:CRISPR-associated helicase Cas3' [Candidatus Omnitrophota bacterium]